MKKTILFAAFVIIAVSCTQTTTEPCPPVREPVGYNNLSEDFTGAVIGNNETVAIWQQYLEYHNDRNFDGIQELDADSIQIYAADGRLVKGAEEHRASLCVGCHSFRHAAAVVLDLVALERVGCVEVRDGPCAVRTGGHLVQRCDVALLDTPQLVIAGEGAACE